MANHSHDQTLVQDVDEITPIQNPQSGTEIDKPNSPNIQGEESNLSVIKDLLYRLGLEKKYEKNLTKADVLEISESTLQNKEPSKENQLVDVFMERLLSGDYTARHISVKTTFASQKSQDEGQVNDFADLFKKTGHKESSQAQIHPMDVQMAVFLCADDFLRQVMVTKLAQCQYAIPLLVPNPFSGKIECPLWTIRQINKNWNLVDDCGEIVSKTLCVYKEETPMVAFFRLGSVSSSKSQLINNLIHERHDTFFHKHCPGSSRTRLLMDGVVEIAWYCPSGKSSDHFSECVAFCNLHGDSSNAVIQRDILTNTSSVNVILLSKLDEKDHNMSIVHKCCDSQTPLIVVITDEEDENEDTVCEIGKGKYRVSLKGRNQADVSVLLRGVIKRCLLQSLVNFNVGKMAKCMLISVDEFNEVCQKGKEAAQRVVCLLDGKDPLTLKEKYLPCQGKLWRDWCQQSKDLHLLTCGESRRQMKELRRKQQELGFSGFMGLFVGNLNSLSEHDRMYFLSWTKIFLDDLMTARLSNVHQVPDKKVSLNGKEYTDPENETSNLQDEKLSNSHFSNKPNAVSIGLEHILREMGQIYEASVSEGKDMTGFGNFSYLPELAAEVLISGHPVELMDGDTAYVPITWVSELLHEVVMKLGDPRVFVLSVLGIQSSGKSTMLNAMFGLEFAVSAGRCTRGAFMQLVKVSEDKKKELKFDYILVVDTGGLRTSELSGSTIDDKVLSTFVVGLANLTLINIFGENILEMQEILQIVVHAFLRMKQVRLNPSCMFVHQNVCDVAAREKIMYGRRHLQETLDKMTKVAAKDENLHAERFSDVIKFDVENDVKYISQLWEGSPPMAPPNPHYSENIQNLKRDILSCAGTTDVLKLSKVQKRVKDLWDALLKENFVFSCRNAQERCDPCDPTEQDEEFIAYL